MSLRTEIREAIDEVAPPAPGLVYEVLDSVFERARPKAHRRLSLRFRAPLALVAVLVALSLIAVLVIGGRLLRDTQTPAGHHPQSGFQRQVAELEARPLGLPALPTGAPCPDGGVTYTSGTQYGNGPVWVYRGFTTSTPWGEYVDVTFRYVIKANEIIGPTPALTGPIVVRGRDLNLGWDVGFVGADATGAVVGNDPSHAPPELRALLVIDTGHPESVEDNSRTIGHIPTYGLTTAQLGFRAGSSGCFGLQIDTNSPGQPPTETITLAG